MRVMRESRAVPLELGELLDRAHQEPFVITHVLGTDDVFQFDLIDEEAAPRW